MQKRVDGVGPDAPLHVNDLGGRQSAVKYRFDLIDAPTILGLAEILHHGAEKYGDTNWRAISTREHLNHALVHIYAHFAGDTQDDHLGHAFCRLMMAKAIEIQGGPKPDVE